MNFLLKLDDTLIFFLQFFITKNTSVMQNIWKKGDCYPNNPDVTGVVEPDCSQLRILVQSSIHNFFHIQAVSTDKLVRLALVKYIKGKQEKYL